MSVSCVSRDNRETPRLMLVSYTRNASLSRKRLENAVWMHKIHLSVDLV